MPGTCSFSTCLSAMWCSFLVGVSLTVPQNMGRVSTLAGFRSAPAAPPGRGRKWSSRRTWRVPFSFWWVGARAGCPRPLGRAGGSGGQVLALGGAVGGAVGIVGPGGDAHAQPGAHVGVGAVEHHQGFLDLALDLAVEGPGLEVGPAPLVLGLADGGGQVGEGGHVLGGHVLLGGGAVDLCGEVGGGDVHGGSFPGWRGFCSPCRSVYYCTTQSGVRRPAATKSAGAPAVPERPRGGTRVAGAIAGAGGPPAGSPRESPLPKRGAPLPGARPDPPGTPAPPTGRARSRCPTPPARAGVPSDRRTGRPSQRSRWGSRGARRCPGGRARSS